LETEEKIRLAYNRLLNVFRKRPEAALSSIHATAIVREGLSCEFTQGEHTAIMDMPDIMGGDGLGPTPGFFGRAAVAGCVSMGLKLLAAAEGLALKSITVDIDTDFDDSASLGLGDNSAAPLETRLTISFDTDEPEDKVRKLVDRLLERDPWYLALRDAQSVQTQITFKD
jgi:uncharacterized OsmC-like protein